MDIEQREAMDYEVVSAELEAMGALPSAAEIHGLVCGQVAAGFVGSEETWLTDFLNQIEPKEAPDTIGQTTLKAMYATVQQVLASHALAFELLLPDDDAPLETRMDALGRWCEGFLAGFGLHYKGKDDLPEDLVKALRDLSAITEVDVESGAEDHEGEADFFNVVEYVRVVVMSVYTECVLKPNGQNGVSENERTLH